MKKREIGAFEGMMDIARGWLAGKAPQEIAERAGVEFDGEAFHLRSLGQAVRASFPDYEVAPELDAWHGMVVLHYLNLADGAPLTGRLISYAELKGGLARGVEFDHRCEAFARDVLGKLNEAELRARCSALGAEFVESNADLCAVLPFLPRFPLTLKLWFADEEFPASGRLLLDASAEHYLTIEDAVTAGEICIRSLSRHSLGTD